MRANGENGEAKEAQGRDSRSLWNPCVHRQVIIFYLVGMLWGEAGTLDAKEISSRSCIVLANLRWS